MFLVSLSPFSKYAPIFEALLSGRFTILLSNEVVTEYEEIIAQRYDNDTVQDVLRLLVSLQNAELIVPHYHWRLIVNDPDDNKFVDLPVAGNADYIVTNDRHFKVLTQTSFPVVKTIKAEEFLEMLAVE
ncbi:MAG: putative toxin-antitoxin system toxin component, PIN family [Thermoanaerobaculia bacterium]|nr:putative toxin-antitoxin system toxin component, PIN family [Thermoanaerobaculia bacterium]